MKNKLYRVPSHVAFRGLLLGALVAALTACAGMSDEMSLYQMASQHYEQAMRWQNYDAMISFHKNDRARVTPEQLKRLMHFKVTAYKIVSDVVDPDTRHAAQTVQIKYFNTDYQIVHDMTLLNRWEYDAKSKHWYLLNPPPVFK